MKKDALDPFKSFVKKPAKKVVVPATSRLNHMTYNTYKVFSDFIEKQKNKAHQEYCVAADHTYEWDYDGSSSPQFNRNCKVLPPSVRDFMWENYRKQILYYNEMFEQLRHAAKMSNSIHPNPEMRKFWGIES